MLKEEALAERKLFVRRKSLELLQHAQVCLDVMSTLLTF